MFQAPPFQPEAFLAPDGPMLGEGEPAFQGFQVDSFQALYEGEEAADTPTLVQFVPWGVPVRRQVFRVPAVDMEAEEEEALFA